MKNTALLLISICFLFASCGKDPKEEWSRFYGFTQADIVGCYEANPDESLYEDLPTEGMTIYNNASINVSPVGDVSISLNIIIPDRINKYFSGPLEMSNDHRSDITLTNVINTTNKEDIMMTVYKNDQGQVRFHGRVKRYYYVTDNWGFDVVKE